MHPRFPSSKSLFHNTYRSARQHPRVTLGVAAASVATVAGVWAGISAGSAPAVRTVSNVGAMSHGSAVRTAGQAVVAHADVQAVGTKPAPRQSPRTVRVRLATRRPQAGGNHATTAPGARRGFARQRLAHAQRPRPFLIYDSVTPTAIPPHHMVATYATGGFAVPAAEVAGRHVMWIDTNGTDPRAAALDVEPGDATPSQAASWAAAKLNLEPRAKAIIYTMRSEWPAAQAAVAGLPHWMRYHIRWWIADPTGYPHVVPGSNATQWYWGQNYDITTATPGF